MRQEHPTRRALVVRGGWPGHDPVAATDLFRPLLEQRGYRIRVAETLQVYTDAALLADTDLIVGCWSMGDASRDQVAGLRDAVAAGTGFAGWHGGIVDAFRASPAYLQLVGGQFAEHPGGFVDHELTVRPERADHPIVAGIDRVALHTEQYWVLTDELNDVLATTTLAAGPGTPWAVPVTVPAVWTRAWGRGRVFACTVGHGVPELSLDPIRAIIERGMAWAGR